MMTGEYETGSFYNSGNLEITQNLSQELLSKSTNDVNINVYSSTSDETIHFILPLSARFETFKRFLSVYEDVCLKNKANVALFISLFKDKNASEDFDKTIDLVQKYMIKYRSAKIEVTPILDIEFSRAYALQMGVYKCINDCLLLFIDVDMIFNTRALWNVRMNTIKHKQLYFPIVFSEYNPLVVYDPDYATENSLTMSSDYFCVTEQAGYFRQFGYGIASLYKSDLDLIGGLNSNIKGWGLEDVQLFDKCVNSNLTIFRSADANFVHAYHTVVCDNSLDLVQYKMCQGTKSNTYANYEQLVMYIRRHANVLKFGNNKSNS